MNTVTASQKQELFLVKEAVVANPGNAQYRADYYSKMNDMGSQYGALAKDVPLSTSPAGDMANKFMSSEAAKSGVHVDQDMSDRIGVGLVEACHREVTGSGDVEISYRQEPEGASPLRQD